MNNYKLIKSFKLNNNINSCDIHLFYNDNNGYIISNEGISILLSNKYKNELLNNNLSEQLKYKLILKGFTSNNKRYNNFFNDININFFIILMTDKCNFNCHYCYRDLKKGGSNINKEKLTLILDKIIKYYNDKKIPIIVQPFGGEPLFAYDLILYMDDYFKNHNAKIRIVIQTNASLINEEIAKELYKRNISIGVSIDGCEKIHNKYRLSIDNKPTYELVTKGIANLSKYYNNLSSISVVSKDSLNYIYESIYELEKLKIKNFKFNLLYKGNDRVNKEIKLNEEDIKLFIDKLFESIIKINKDGKGIIEVNIYNRILNLLKGYNHSTCYSDGCLAGSNIVTIDFDGNIYPCKIVDKKMIIGNIKNDFDYQIKSFLNSNSFFYKKVCDNCIWYSFCKGGCKSKSFFEETKIDELGCILNKYIYPKLINYILNDKEKINLLTNNIIKIEEK